MQNKNILYYIKRICNLGPLGALHRIQNRSLKKIFAIKWRQKAIAGNANHTWEQITQKEKYNLDFETFFARCIEHDFIKFSPRAHQCIKDPTQPKFPDLFYQEMKTSSDHDVRNAWDISRFHQAFPLGGKYKETKDEMYAKEFHHCVDSWIEQNKFLIGVNWMCPMEVAIRAINWIFAFPYFCKSESIPLDFWKKFTCSLYDHLIYLENNWETSDRPNNHYIADLLGHFFLCHFFDKRCPLGPTKILEQFNHQIHPDGTSYEGSTAYHKLDTELFWLFSLLCKAKKISLPNDFTKKLNCMFEFASDCMVNEDFFVQIGDDDSGKIVTGISVQENNACATKHYKDFGLTIIKNKTWHITFRHPTYQKHQPTGHFHDDHLSITVAYNGIPILVDPGSFLYTGNPQQRNIMRSFNSHNTFYPASEKNIDSSIDLFQLPRKKQNDTAQIVTNQNEIIVQNSYKEKTRKLVLCKTSELVMIEDRLVHAGNCEYIWTLLFHPSVKVRQKNSHDWEIHHEKNKILCLTTNLTFESAKALYSPRYGQADTTAKLTCSKNFYERPQEKVFFTLHAT